MIQQAVRSTVGEDKVAVNVNADEAAVLGAGLHGASLSRQFKTKDIKVSEVYVYDIQASYTTVPKEGGSPKTITSTIFPPGSKTGSKKTLTFKRKDDFSIKLLYKKTPFAYVFMVLADIFLMMKYLHPAIILRELSRPRLAVSLKPLPT